MKMERKWSSSLVRSVAIPSQPATHPGHLVTWRWRNWGSLTNWHKKEAQKKQAFCKRVSHGRWIDWVEYWLYKEAWNLLVAILINTTFAHWVISSNHNLLLFTSVTMPYPFYSINHWPATQRKLITLSFRHPNSLSSMYKKMVKIKVRWW